jgi:Tol biopolymer transport system component
MLAAGFDPSARRLTGPAVPILDGVGFKDAQANFSLSPSGDLVYVEGAGQPEVRLAVTDLQGNEEVLPLGPRAFTDAGWSRDGASVVYSLDGHIYTYNVVLNTTPRQLTFEGVNRRPVLSPDGSAVVFTSVRAGAESPALWVKSLDDDSPPRLLLPGLDGSFQNATQWPSDSLIVFNRNGDLWTVDLSDPEDPRAEVYLTSEAFLRGMVVSPDGTKAAYVSLGSGSSEVYIRSFPEAGAPTRVSQSGGGISVWSPDGSILYYRISGGGLLGARIQPGPVPVALAVDTVLERGVGPQLRSAILHPDGDRLIVLRQVAGPGDDPVAEGRVILVKNFLEELKRLVPN